MAKLENIEKIASRLVKAFESQEHQWVWGEDPAAPDGVRHLKARLGEKGLDRLVQFGFGGKK